LKKLSFGNKIVYFFNSLFAVLLLLSYLIPFIKPSYLPVISTLSLLVPVLLIINILFFIYWLIGFKKQMMLSLLCLLLGFNYATSFYKFQSKEVISNTKTSLMSYNVRLFNIYNWIDDNQIKNKILDFAIKENPDLLCLQEYHPQERLEKAYPYRFEDFTDTKNKSGLVIFSKYRIVNKGTLRFNNSSNSSIYIDIIKKRDTLRIYNVHLESLHINPEKENLSKNNSQKLIKRIGKAFSKQQEQVLAIKANMMQTTYKKILCGDFNNTVFSWAYRNLKSEFNDSFSEAGSGFGTTYNFKRLPVRIDFILADKALKVLRFKNYKVKYSDHYPIESVLEF